MPESILDSTKKVLGIDAAYTAFDQDVTMHINSVFSTLQQLGVGADHENSFFVTGKDETWEQFIGAEKNVNAVKSYMYLRVRLLFDPPATSFAQDSMQKQANELEWRLNVQMEGVRHPFTPTTPSVPPVVEPEVFPQFFVVSPEATPTPTPVTEDAIVEPVEEQLTPAAAREFKVYFTEGHNG